MPCRRRGAAAVAQGQPRVWREHAVPVHQCESVACVDCESLVAVEHAVRPERACVGAPALHERDLDVLTGADPLRDGVSEGGVPEPVNDFETPAIAIY